MLRLTSTQSRQLFSAHAKRFSALTPAAEGAKAVAAEVSPKPAEPAALPPPRNASGGSLFHRLSAFFVGAALVALIGLYKLEEDIEASSTQLQHSVERYAEATAETNEELRRRIAHLEQQVSIMAYAF